MHGLGAGTDTGALWMDFLYLGTGSVVVLFSSYRLLRHGARAPAPRATPGRGQSTAGIA
jgi:hypothetical protein